jgi:tol-pal system protein YbgF
MSFGRLGKMAIISLLLLGLTACASQRDLQYVQGDMDEVKSRLFRMEKDISGLKVETKGSVEGVIKNLNADIGSLRKGLADLQATQEMSKVDMQVLGGKVDDVKIMAQKPGDEVSLLRDDLRLRLANLDQRLQKIEKELQVIAAERALLKEKEAEKQKTPESLYQSGVDLYKEGEFSKARDAFKRFLETNSKDPLAANAHYWLGETYYSERNFEEAILEFQEVIKNYPDNNKVPAALLKQGYSWKETGNAKRARITLKKLVETFPSSPEAAKAKEKLKDMK